MIIDQIWSHCEHTMVTLWSNYDLTMITLINYDHTMIQPCSLSHAICMLYFCPQSMTPWSDWESLNLKLSSRRDWRRSHCCTWARVVSEVSFRIVYRPRWMKLLTPSLGLMSWYGSTSAAFFNSVILKSWSVCSRFKLTDIFLKALNLNIKISAWVRVSASLQFICVKYRLANKGLYWVSSKGS